MHYYTHMRKAVCDMYNEIRNHSTPSVWVLVGASLSSYIYMYVCSFCLSLSLSLSPSVAPSFLPAKKLARTRSMFSKALYIGTLNIQLLSHRVDCFSKLPQLL